MTEIKKENKNMSNVPNLRFPGFEGEWEVRKLGEVCKMQAGKFVSASEINIISNSNLFPCYGGNGLRGYTKSFNQHGKYSLIGRQGALCGNVTLVNGKFHATEHAIVVTPDINIDTDWMFYLLTYLNLNQFATGMAQPGLSVQNLEKVEVIIPKSKAEQQKKGAFLSLIDKRIQTQSKIIEELKILKATLAHDIYSQQLRFHDKNNKDFCDWKVIKLGTVMSIPEKIKPKEIEKEKLLTVKLHMKGVLKNVNTESLSIGSTSYYLRKKGQFIYGKQNLFNGAFAIIPDKFDGFLSSSDVPSLEIDKTKLNNVFLFNFFGREKFYRKLEDIASGSGSKRIHEETLLKVKIQLPCLEEQTKIANLLSQIDEKIEIEKQLLIQYENQKKYLLQNLFI
ncbi:restriction endonuclease subunit S [Flavobacterium magnesitis]|uniref:restriction endonuclease subunit S n=1 Tax=Flavobacterium magnesitis TaxID=3138077 RepID=UPI00358F9736